jgi:hypothetical protein
VSVEEQGAKKAPDVCRGFKMTGRRKKQLWEIGDMVDVLEAWEAKRERPAAAG